MPWAFSDLALFGFFPLAGTPRAEQSPGPQRHRGEAAWPLWRPPDQELGLSQSLSDMAAPADFLAIRAARDQAIKPGSGPWPRRLLALAAGLSLAVPSLPAQAFSPSTWLSGTFPVVSFAGFTSGFGMRTHPLGGDRRPHYGVDIAAPLGSEVRSWWSGRVSELIRDGGCGNGLVIRSGDYEHIYCHLAGTVAEGAYRSGAIRLGLGQPVRSGQSIAHVGLTGSSTGPHLHWGMRFRGQWLDPARILRAMANSRRSQPLTSAGPPKVGSFR